MVFKFIGPMRLSFLALVVVPVLALASCKVTLIGAYNKNIHESIESVQNKVVSITTTLLVNFENGNTTSNSFANFERQYLELRIDLQNLKIWSHALVKYKIVASQVDLLEANIISLEQLHRTGFSAKSEVEVLQRTFEVQFGTIIRLQAALKTKG